MTHENFHSLGALWSVPSKEALADPAHPHWTGKATAVDAAARKQTSMSMLIGGSTAFDCIVRDPCACCLPRARSARRVRSLGSSSGMQRQLDLLD
jgi:hypothetical protein